MDAWCIRSFLENMPNQQPPRLTGSKTKPLRLTEKVVSKARQMPGILKISLEGRKHAPKSKLSALIYETSGDCLIVTAHEPGAKQRIRLKLAPGTSLQEIQVTLNAVRA